MGPVARSYHHQLIKLKTSLELNRKTKRSRNDEIYTPHGQCHYRTCSKSDQAQPPKAGAIRLLSFKFHGALRPGRVLILILHKFSQLINVFKYVNWACFELNKMKGAFHYTKNVAFLIFIRKYYRDWTEDRNVSVRETLSTVRTQAINLRFWHRRNDKVPNYHIIGVQNRRIRYKNTNNPTRIISKHNHFNCQICSSPEDSCCAELLPLTRNVS